MTATRGASTQKSWRPWRVLAWLCAIFTFAVFFLGATFGYLVLTEPDYLRAQAEQWTYRFLELEPLKSVRVEQMTLLDDGIWVEPMPSAGKLVSAEKLMAMLHTRKFALLDEHIEKLQQAFERDRYEDQHVVDAFDALSSDALEVGELIDAWIAERPSSYAARLARANHRYGVAWHLRGGKYVSQTSRVRMWLMRMQMTGAIHDARKALEARPKLLSAVHTLLSIAITLGDKHGVNEFRGWAFALAPHAESTFGLALRAARPRWGGSYEQVARLSELGQPHAVRRQNLRALSVFADIDRADLLVDDKRYDEALQLYDRAIATAEHWSYLSDRAACLKRLKRPNEALRDLDRAVELHPQSAALHYERFFVHAHLRHYRAASEDLLLAARLEPTSPTEEDLLWAVKGLLYDGAQHEKRGDFQGASALYELAQQLEPNNRQVGGQSTRARLRAAPTSPAAIAELARLADANEHDFEAHLRVDAALFQAKRYNDIFPHWDKYIAAHPNDARAYYERAGVAHFAKRPQQAADDALKSCTLGYERSCARLGLFGLTRPTPKPVEIAVSSR